MLITLLRPGSLAETYFGPAGPSTTYLNFRLRTVGDKTTLPGPSRKSATASFAGSLRKDLLAVALPMFAEVDAAEAAAAEDINLFFGGYKGSKGL